MTRDMRRAALRLSQLLVDEPAWVRGGLALTAETFCNIYGRCKASACCCWALDSVSKDLLLLVWVRHTSC